MDPDLIRVYWLPGCSVCIRVKGYLTTRGVEFAAINIQDDPDGADDLAGLGASTLPVVRVGDRFVAGFDLSAIDRLLQLGDDRAHDVLPWVELQLRAKHLLHAAVRLARQLPPSHFDDPIPGMQDLRPQVILPNGKPLLRTDGTPYVPHQTSFGLVCHIVGHGAKFQLMAEDPDMDVSDAAEFVQLGEPDESQDLEQVCAEAARIARAIEDDWRDDSVPELARVMESFSGPQTLHQMLHIMVYSLTQHTRQLMVVLQELGIEPDGPLTDEDYAGLELPANVWD